MGVGQRLRVDGRTTGVWVYGRYCTIVVFLAMTIVGIGILVYFCASAINDAKE